MNSRQRQSLVPLLACALAVMWAAGIRAADAKSDVEKKISATLVAVIDHGVDLYNSGDANGCYRLYEGSLLSLKPFLDGKAEWQKTIDTALADADKQANTAERAFTLRRAMDKIYFDINPKKADTTKPETKPEPPKTTTLWDRLGGEKGVSKVVDDYVAAAAKDPKVNFDRDGKFKLDDKAVADLKKKLVEFVSSATNGPLKYTGKSMKDVHKGMGITDAQFDANAAHFKKALESNGVKQEDVDAVMKAVEGRRKDIVETTKPEPPKPEPPKPADPAKTGDVKGVVTLNGQPLAKATIQFVPDKGDAVSANTGDDGSYSLKQVKP